MKRYLHLTKRPSSTRQPFVQGAGSSKMTDKQQRKLNEDTKKLETWKNL
jgi:hypothetical protein